MQQPIGLISVLVDATARDDERDDAAMGLRGYDEPEAEEALAKVSIEGEAPDIVLASCGESLAEIWCRKGKINMEILERLTGIVRAEALSYIRASKPALLSDVN